jgi:hypothetical protein
MSNKQSPPTTSPPVMAKKPATAARLKTTPTRPATKSSQKNEGRRTLQSRVMTGVLIGSAKPDAVTAGKQRGGSWAALAARLDDFF